MTIYLIFLVITAIAGFLVKNEKVGNLVVLVVLFFTVFRNETVGIDTYNYVHGGYTIWADGMRTYEVLYEWLSSFVPSSGSQLLLIVFGVITFTGIYVASKKWNVLPVCSLFFFILFEYYNLSLNIARQYAAIGFLLIGYSFLLEKGKKRLWFIFFVVLASSLHTSSIVFLLTYFCRKIDFSKVNKLLLMSVLLTIAILLNTVLKEYYLQLAQVVELTGDIEVYARYFDQAEDYGLSIGGTIIAYSTLFVNFYIFTALAGNKTEQGRLLASLFFVSIVFDVFFVNLFGNLGRFRYSIDIINIIAYSWYFKFLEKYSVKKYIVAIIMCVFYGYSLVYSLMGADKAYGTVPYELCLIN